MIVVQYTRLTSIVFSHLKIQYAQLIDRNKCIEGKRERETENNFQIKLTYLLKSDILNN